MKKRIRVKGPGVKLNNIWCYINDEAIIDEEQYEKNKEYVEVIEEIEENPNPEGEQETPSDDGSDTNVGGTEEGEESSEEESQENPEADPGENPGTDPGENSGEGNDGENPGEENEGEDEELEALKEKAKGLGINVTHNMKKETIIKKIEEKEAETGEGQNPEGE